MPTDDHKTREFNPQREIAFLKADIVALTRARDVLDRMGDVLAKRLDRIEDDVLRRLDLIETRLTRLDDPTA